MSKVWSLTAAMIYLESRIDAVEKNAVLALAASEKAINKAELGVKDRLDAGNEIRGAMVDQQKHFADKEATDRRFEQLKEQLADMKKSQDADVNRAMGAGKLAVVIGSIVAGSGALTTLIVILTRATG